MSDPTIQLLQNLQTSKLTLAPTPNPLAPYGYGYPEALSLLEIEVGQDIPTLNQLSERGLLEREVIDKIHLCPYCQHFALNFREVCPQCQSHFIAEVDMLHHYACGYVSFEAEFQQGEQLICPKCRKTISHLGVDYERSATNFRCKACTYVFPEPETGCLSLSCSQSFLIERAIIQPIFSYKLSPQGHQVATQGTLEGSQAASSFVSASDRSDFQYFETELTREIDRALIHQRPFCVLLFSPENFELYESLMGEEAADALFQTLLEQTNTLIRKCDLVTIYKNRFLLFLLPETDHSTCQPMADDFETQLNTNCLKELGSEMTFKKDIIEHDSTIDSCERMYELVEEHIPAPTQPNA